MKNRFKSSSKYYLSQKKWRYLRKILPGNIWSKLYSLKQKLLLNILLDKIRKNYPDSCKDQRKDNSYAEIIQKIKAIKDQESLKILLELFHHYQTDKHSIHNYHHIYSALFGNLREKIGSILEIGIYKGSSLRSWAGYFKNAKIYGVDIDPNTMFIEDRIITSVVDQNSLGSLKKYAGSIGEGFDIIIDDGWHQPEASINTILAFLPLLNMGGFYILEDINPSLYLNFYKNVSNILNRSGLYVSHLIDLNVAIPEIKSEKDSCIMLIIK